MANDYASLLAEAGVTGDIPTGDSVFLGPRKKAPVVQPSTAVTASRAGLQGARAVKGLPLEAEAPPDDGEDETQSADEMKKDLYRKLPGDLSALQKRLFVGGFYNASLDAEDIRWGDYDEQTKLAYDRAVDRAASFYGAGQKKTFDQVLDDAVTRGTETGLAGQGSARAKTPPSFSHPDDIRTVAMRISSKVLGKGWNESQLDQFVKTYQAMETAATADPGGMSQPDVSTAAESAARAGDPVAAGGTDMANAYTLMMQAMQRLGGGR